MPSAATVRTKLRKEIRIKLKSGYLEDTLQNDLILVWRALVDVLSATDYQFDRVIWAISPENGDSAVFPGAPDDVACIDSPIIILFDIHGIEEVLDGLEDKQKELRFYKKVRAWSRKIIKSSWSNPKTKDLIDRLSLPHGKLAVFTSDHPADTGLHQLKWLCGNRISAQADLPTQLRLFAEEQGIGSAEFSFYVENGSIKRVYFISETLLGIDEGFLDRFEPLASQLMHSHRPESVTIADHVNVSRHLISKLSSLLGNCKVQRMSEKECDNFLRRLSLRAIEEKYEWLDDDW